MKGNPDVIRSLNEVLAGELVAINQYFLHAKMCSAWGYKALADHARSESIDEMRHAELLTDRILFLEGLPNLQRLDKLHIGQNVTEQMQSDLALEMRALKTLGDALVVCRDAADTGSESLLEPILLSEERHVQWLEIQLGLIAKLGEPAYLAQQIG